MSAPGDSGNRPATWPGLPAPRPLPVLRQAHAGRCPRLLWRGPEREMALTALEAIRLGEQLIAAGRKRLEWQRLDPGGCEPDPDSGDPRRSAAP